MRLPFTRTHRFLIRAALLFLLLLAIAVQAGRLLGQIGGMSLDLSGRDIGSLSPRTRTFLSRLQSPLSITYFVSSREKMPSRLKGVEASVRALLKALRDRAPASVDIRVIDPEAGGAQGVLTAARKKVSPFMVGEIHLDEHSEEEVWSSLVLSYADHPDLLIQKVTPPDLPTLEDLIVRSLEGMENPVRPIFAVSASPAFQPLKEILKTHGRVLEIDLNRNPSIPPEADLLFWIEPNRVTPGHIREFRRFVESGRTALLAGSAYSVAYEREETGRSRYRSSPPSTAWQALLAPFGITPQPDLLLDRSAGPVTRSDARGNVSGEQAPFYLRVLPGFYSLKGFALPARGALNFVAASPLQIDPNRLSASGFRAEILGTTTENARVHPLPPGLFSEADLTHSLAVGKQNLMVLLRPEDPWHGQILVLGSASPFRAGIFNQPNTGHRVFLQNLLRTFTGAERLVRGRVDRSAPPPIPPLSSAARIFWRGIAVFLIPLALLVIGARRTLPGGFRWSTLQAPGQLSVRIGAGLVLVLLSTRVWKNSRGFALDLTENAANTPLPLTRRLLAPYRETLNIDHILTPRASLPVALKPVGAAVRSQLRTLGIPSRTTRPEALSHREQIGLGELGIRPFDLRTVHNDTLTSRQVWSGLLVRKGDRSTSIPRLDPRTLDHLEFLVVAAANRLESGRRPHIALIAESPRLSPAEAFEYHQKGISPPQGADVFSEIRVLLRAYGYRVTPLNPKAPHLPEGVDLLLWLQPRRDSGQIIRLLGLHLAGGGKAAVALQHFNIQQRQYRGSGFQTVYWPQPQYQDLDRYLTPLGVEQIREILMDRTRSRLSLETQIHRRAVREYERQEVALPFLIRAVGTNLSTASPITRNLGDQLFIWGNRFALHADRLNALGIDSEVLIQTSAQAWSYAWKGGWLPEAVFRPESYLSGPQPLAVRLQGKFPPVDFLEGGDLTLQTPVPDQAEGTLLLIGSSEMFKNDHLYADRFQHDQFLLNAVADLVYGPEMAELQARRNATRGFEFQSPRLKTIWRLAVVAVGPLLILAYGLHRYVRHSHTFWRRFL